MFEHFATKGEIPRKERAELRFILITEEADLTALAPYWAALLPRSDCNEPMLSPNWLLPWWEIYGRGTRRRLRVGAWFEGARLVGLALLQYRWICYRKLNPFRRLEFLGADVDEKDGVCSEYLNLIAERGTETHVAGAFAAALRSGRFGPWDELIISGFDRNHPRLEHLTSAFGSLGFRMEQSDGMTAPYIPLPATWEEYLHSLGRNKRLVVKSLRDLQVWAGDRLQLHRATCRASLVQGQQILRELHAERWRKAGLQGAFQAPRFARFHDKVMAAFFDADALDLRWMTVAGDPISVAYSLRWDNKIYFYQSGRKMNVPAHIRAGIALHAETIRAALEAGLREYDFMGGAAQYKSQLSTASRQLLRLRIQKTRWRENLRRATEFSIGKMRSLRAFLRWLRRAPDDGRHPQAPQI